MENPKQYFWQNIIQAFLLEQLHIYDMEMP